MSGTLLKTIALLTMVTDHVGVVIDNGVMRCIGRVAFILFAFSCAEGWRLTRDKDAYLCKLLVWAGISQLPYMLFKGALPVFWINDVALFAGTILAIWMFGELKDISYLDGSMHRSLLLLGSFLLPMVLYQDVVGGVPEMAELNVLYTMAAACFGMKLIDNGLTDMPSLFQFILMLMFCGVKCDYSVLGIILIMVFYKLNDKGLRWQAGAAVAWSAFVYLFGSDAPMDFVGAIAGSMIIVFYNRSRGAGTKWYRNIFYWFYPVHMLLLWMISEAGILG